MKMTEFQDKLADFLQETVGKYWQWQRTDVYDTSICFKGFVVWGLEPDEEDEE